MSSRPTGVCRRPVCRKPVYGGREFCSHVCETAGPGLRSGSEGCTGRPSYGGDRDLSVLSGLLGAADEAVHVRQGEPRLPPEPDDPLLPAEPEGSECRECGALTDEARLRLLRSRGSPVTCGTPCAKRIWRRYARRRAAENARKKRAGAAQA
jgi:hypothetical protein